MRGSAPHRRPGQEQTLDSQTDALQGAACERIFTAPAARR